MKRKVWLWMLSTVMLAFMVQVAQAGVIRYAGKELYKGSVKAGQAAEAGGADVAGGAAAVGEATKDGAQAAAGDASKAGSAAGGAIKSGLDTTKDGAVDVGKGAAQAPGLVAHGTAAAAKSLWRAIW
ncbi:MAG TPA: hypothetical protein VMX16_19640 [Terriglobia bacterium]|nr:hypothetical protein [Terriglobia bacterium]